MPLPTSMLAGSLASSTGLAADGLHWARLAGLLRVAVLLGVVWFCYDVLARLVARELLSRRLVRSDPRHAGAIRAAVREEMPLLRRRQKRVDYPLDPFALGTPVVVPPLGDGRPGERFLAAGPSTGGGPLGPTGTRTEASVLLAPGVYLLVVCLGRIGAVRDETNPHNLMHGAATRITEPERPSAVRRQMVGPVERGVTAAGEAWRHTYRIGSTLVTDTHVDFDGWAFVIGVVRPVGFVGAERILDGVLASWSWVPDGGLARHA